MKQVLSSVLTLLLLTTTAQAATEPSTLFKGRYWKTFGIASSNDGQPLCGMEAKFQDVGRLYVKWTAQDGVALQVWKPSWRIDEGTNVPFQLEFFDDAKAGESDILKAAAALAMPTVDGVGSTVSMTVNGQDMARLLRAFSDADRLSVNFPQGDEPQWNTKMDGSRKAANEFISCIYLVKQTTLQPTHPAGEAPIKREPDDGGI